jgi:hypothetical protein
MNKTLSMSIERPGDVLVRGEHCGLPYIIMNNGLQFRCGYVRLQLDHPWVAQEVGEIEVDVHGGLTWAERDEDGYWIGFDCAHAGDAPDRSLLKRGSDYAWPSFTGLGTVKNQEYVKAELEKLCEQAAAQSAPSA